MIINEKQRANDPIDGCGYLFPVDIESEIQVGSNKIIGDACCR
ncbi:MAG: hypothetical protein WCP85_28055 [Mariniphaga sp.]